MTTHLGMLLREITLADGTRHTHIATRPTVIGSGEALEVIGVPDGDLLAIPDSSMSRPHAVFAATPQGWVVDDAASALGTYLVTPLGEMRLDGHYRVEAGQTYRAGTTLIKVAGC